MDRKQKGGSKPINERARNAPGAHHPNRASHTRVRKVATPLQHRHNSQQHCRSGCQEHRPPEGDARTQVLLPLVDDDEEGGDRG
jgi:hypothetical protein